MSKKMDDLLTGEVGHFWPFEQHPGKASVQLDGFVHRNDSRLMEVKTLDTDDSNAGWKSFQSDEVPPFVACITANTGALLMRPAGHTYFKTLGGMRAATRNFRYRTAVAEVAVGDLLSGQLLGLEMRFRDMLRWARMPVVEVIDDVSKEGHGRVTTIRLDAKDREDKVRLYDGMTLHLSPSWSFQIDGDTFSTIETPLQARVVTRSPKPFELIVRPLLDFQLLLSLAHGAFVPCTDSSAKLHYKASHDSRREWSPLYDQRMTEVPPNPGKVAKPLFSYEDMGAARGVSRWLKFNRSHGRFVGPVAMRPIFSSMSVTTRLMELYAATEYYIAAGRRAKAPWAPRKTEAALALARHGGSNFQQWVGDIDKWANLLNWMNNRIKHDPVDNDALDVYWLGESAATLIAVISLNHASQRGLAARRFLTASRTARIGQEIRELLDRYPDKLPRR